MTAEKVRENRLRRVAQRQGLRLVKSGRRDPRALDYGVYWLILEELADVEIARAAGARTHGEHGMSLDEIEAYLTGDDDE